ncbi:hypothetical protein CCACVL1_13062 [Corchorus capsularis]|uniref:Uncharacterized protein n=1 Tax=Corchorus capsularis TaxID=210143 RepID=A0A1R3ICG7_COCAP|nr:hypothetical protein CCACVL1_13062 [Corchorus capsularis]
MAPNRFHRKGPRSKRKAFFSFSSRFQNRSNLAFTHVATCHQTNLAINPKPFCLHISYSSSIKTSTESTLNPTTFVSRDFQIAHPFINGDISSRCKKSTQEQQVLASDSPWPNPWSVQY